MLISYFSSFRTFLNNYFSLKNNKFKIFSYFPFLDNNILKLYKRGGTNLIPPLHTFINPNPLVHGNIVTIIWNHLKIKFLPGLSDCGGHYSIHWSHMHGTKWKSKETLTLISEVRKKFPCSKCFLIKYGKRLLIVINDRFYEIYTENSRKKQAIIV